ncbi:hypothetical protein HPP92_012733 [Vanilla planifolia]|uniref:Non-specific serine/threonine protein kinase n=1 Tax=Vanilla planifolia TaxID=51239 RepID=A0A835QW69_VANPL|nr:hypothetical protein HPP92_012733 [Vanilla planifolia]
MLYILTILINYGVELEETFNHGFATVAPLPWQEITPQLFAQLRSHPKKAVREKVQSLLMILAKISPCSIVYPLLVDVNTFEGQSSEELQSIYSYLNNLDPKLIQEVRLVINELDRISVLWEEQWLSILQDLHTGSLWDQCLEKGSSRLARVYMNPTCLVSAYQFFSSCHGWRYEKMREELRRERSIRVGLLSTKTRPKKLVLLGSDGQKYTYLLKGREDLRLDARIMQLLQAINCCFASSADGLGQSLGVRYYSVTPISGQAGLIQWVEKVTSIYSVYKSWQNRNQLSQLYSNGGMNSNPVPAVLRPSDMFYGKIIPALKEKGIRRVVSRRDWPHEVKRTVLLDLMQETPRQLLWQELWCASEGFKSFHSKIRRFSGSVAAMSIIGHVVGLGDRHLDNILIDFCSGEVVHIDYNVCFDKGRRLKIPEIVPFRLTQTIEAALGLTGVEEWTRDDPHDKAVIVGEEKKGMELAVSLSLFASRFQEIRVPLQEHHDLLASTLLAAESALKRFLGLLIEFEVMSAIFYHADKERSRLLQHETTVKSIAAEASSFSEKSRAYFEAQALEYAQAKSLATEKAQEVTSWIEERGRVLDALRSRSFLDSQAFNKLVPESTQAHCSDLDGDVSRIIADLESELSSAVDALNEYGLILQQILPLNYVVTSPLNRLAHVLELSVNNPSADVLSLARKQAADIVANSSGTALDSLKKEHQDLLSSLEMHAMKIETFNKEHSKLLSSIESDSEAKAKERLLSAFTKLMQPEGHDGREDDSSLDDFRDFRMPGIFTKRKESCQRISWKTDDSPLNDSSFISTELEEHIEKCVLLTGLLHEVQNFVGKDLPSFNIDCSRTSSSEHDWATDFHVILRSVKIWFENYTECVLTEIIEAFVFCNTEVMETLARFLRSRFH